MGVFQLASVPAEGPGKNLEEVQWDEGVRILISNI